MKNILKVVFVIIGTLIGAGFASGQEIYLFFFSYGINGLIGIIISSVLMGIIISKTLFLVKKYQITTYKEFLEIFVKSNENKNKSIVKNIINIVINLFILITFFIMIAGFGAYFSQELGWNAILGSIILAIACFLVFTTSVKGVVKLSQILVPILIIFIILIGILNINEIHWNGIEKYIPQNDSIFYILSAITYCSYNSILLIPVLITLKDYIVDKKQTKYIGIITTLITTILSTILFFILTRVDVDITKLEMPVVYVVSKMAKTLQFIYGFIILGSIFTTAVSLGTSFLQNMTKNKKSYTQFALIMCITSVLISQIGFSNLIENLYPIFGYLGLVQIFMILKNKSVEKISKNW